MKPVRILWCEGGDTYSRSRAKASAKALGLALDTLDLFDLEFTAGGTKRGAFAKGRNLAVHYDILILRAFLPFVSEALTLARLFREEGKTVIDHCLTEEGYAMSKMHDYLRLAKAGVGVPRSLQSCETPRLLKAAAGYGYPCIVKGGHGSYGRHVHRVGSEAELKKRLMHYKPGDVMVQEYLDAPLDYRVMVVGYKALPLYVSRQPAAGDFRTNFELNEIVTAHPITQAPHLKRVAEKAARALGREFTGVDIRCRGKTPLVLEANRRPGYKDFERATGLDVVTPFLKHALARHRKNQARMDSL
jgi:glutathione synthase/RimK-type ligase-like ATP-grasp enzyme